MPRKPRITKKRKVSGLTENQIEYLILSHNLMTQDRPPFENDEEIETAWTDNRDYLLTLWGKEYPAGFACGSRPWAFYRFDLNDERLHRRFWHCRVLEKDRAPEFNFLKENDLLFDGEHEAFLELVKSEQMAREEREKYAKNMHLGD
jgi:hypothetical protein